MKGAAFPCLVYPALVELMEETMKLLDRVRAAVARKGYSPRTEEAYTSWIVRYIRFHGLRHLEEMGEEEIAGFLTHLAVERRMSASSQNQTLSALLFLYRAVLRSDRGDFDVFVRAKQPKRLPVVLTPREVQAVLSELDGVDHLVGGLLYGAGLRISECVSLRVKDLDLERDEIVVRRGKGQVDRITNLPRVVHAGLRAQIAAVLRLSAREG